MNGEAFEKIRVLRSALHEIPCLSGEEAPAMALLKDWLTANADCEIVDCGAANGVGWFYAAHREGSSLPTICFRCDVDAIRNSAGKPFHGCGHDGHAAAVAGLAACLSGQKLGKNALFLFQPAEETGAGAVRCLPLFDREKVDAVFGFHSIPGYPAGTVLLRNGTFACASQGLVIRLTGRQAHAAYPETGVDPTSLASGIVLKLNDFLRQKWRGMVLATVVEMRFGSPSFGISAGEGSLSLTLRAKFGDELTALVGKIVRFTSEEAEKRGIRAEFTDVDVFPETSVSQELHGLAEKVCKSEGIPFLELPEPMRWSEDFGHYAQKAKTLFVGIGAGEDSPALHTDAFTFNDELLPTAIRFFTGVCRSFALS